MNKELTECINAYLSGGGLFNPEMANHDAVRDLLIDCRAALSAQEPALRLPDQWHSEYHAAKGGTLVQFWLPGKLLRDDIKAMMAAPPAQPGTVAVPIATLKTVRERIFTSYGGLSNDCWPGPPTSILQTIDAMLSAPTTQPGTVAVPTDEWVSVPRRHLEHLRDDQPLKEELVRRWASEMLSAAPKGSGHE